MENKDYLENICNMISEIARIAKELLCDIHKQISQSIIAIATIAHEIMLEMPNIEYYGAAGFFRKYPFSLLNIQNCVIRYR